MAEKTEDEDILELTIEELRGTSEWVNDAYQRIKAKTVLFLGGGLALLTFLYADGDTFIPPDTAGKIFYFCGLSLLVGALVALFASLWHRRWEFSITGDDIEKIGKEPRETFLVSRKAYLDYVMRQHLKAYKKNLITYESNHKLLNVAFYPLVIGAIILVVLNIFGAEQGGLQVCKELLERTMEHL